MSCSDPPSLDGCYASYTVLTTIMNLSLKIYLLLNGLIAASGTLMMRYGGKNLDFTQGVIYILKSGYLWLFGMILSWLAGIFFALILTRYEITESFTLYVPLVYLLIILGGLFLFNETLSVTKGIGIFFVFVGLIFLLK